METRQDNITLLLNYLFEDRNHPSIQIILEGITKLSSDKRLFINNKAKDLLDADISLDSEITDTPLRYYRDEFIKLQKNILLFYIKSNIKEDKCIEPINKLISIANKKFGTVTEILEQKLKDEITSTDQIPPLPRETLERGVGESKSSEPERPIVSLLPPTPSLLRRKPSERRFAEPQTTRPLVSRIADLLAQNEGQTSPTTRPPFRPASAVSEYTRPNISSHDKTKGKVLTDIPGLVFDLNKGAETVLAETATTRKRLPRILTPSIKPPIIVPSPAPREVRPAGKPSGVSRREKYILTGGQNVEDIKKLINEIKQYHELYETDMILQLIGLLTDPNYFFRLIERIFKDSNVYDFIILFFINMNKYPEILNIINSDNNIILERDSRVLKLYFEENISKPIVNYIFINNLLYILDKLPTERLLANKNITIDFVNLINEICENYFIFINIHYPPLLTQKPNIRGIYKDYINDKKRVLTFVRERNNTEYQNIRYEIDNKNNYLFVNYLNIDGKLGINKYGYSNTLANDQKKTNVQNIEPYYFGPHDGIFLKNESSNVEIAIKSSDEILKRLIDNDKDVCIIGYGQSGSGKTSTLIQLNTIKDRRPYTQNGIIIELCLLHKFKNNFTNINLKMKNIYVYHGSGVSDVSQVQAKEYKTSNLFDRDINFNYQIKDGSVNWYDIENPTKTLGDYIIDGLNRREVEPTSNNPNSSRSHVIICLTLLKKDSAGTRKLVVCDFAGVENVFNCTNINEINNLDINYSISDKYGVEKQQMKLDRYFCDQDDSKYRSTDETLRTRYNANMQAITNNVTIMTGGENCIPQYTKEMELLSNCSNTLQLINIINPRTIDEYKTTLIRKLKNVEELITFLEGIKSNVENIKKKMFDDIAIYTGDKVKPEEGKRIKVNINRLLMYNRNIEDIIKAYIVTSMEGGSKIFNEEKFKMDYVQPNEIIFYVDNLNGIDMTDMQFKKSRIDTIKDQVTQINNKLIEINLLGRPTELFTNIRDLDSITFFITMKAILDNFIQLYNSLIDHLTSLRLSSTSIENLKKNISTTSVIKTYNYVLNTVDFETNKTNAIIQLNKLKNIYLCDLNRIIKLQYNCQLRVNEGYLINSSLRDLRDDITSLIRKSIKFGDFLPIYFDDLVYPYCRNTNINNNTYQIFNNFNFTPEYEEPDTIKCMNEDISLSGQLLKIMKCEYKIDMSSLIFVIFTIINTNADTKTNNPPNPPYINIDDLINYFNMGNVEEIKNQVNQVIEKCKKYKYYLFDSLFNTIIRPLNNITILSDSDLLVHTNNLIEFIKNNNSLSLIGTLEATDTFKFLSYNRICSYSNSDLTNGLLTQYSGISIPSTIEDESIRKKYLKYKTKYIKLKENLSK